MKILDQYKKFLANDGPLYIDMFIRPVKVAKYITINYKIEKEKEDVTNE